MSSTTSFDSSADESNTPEPDFLHYSSSSPIDTRRHCSVFSEPKSACYSPSITVNSRRHGSVFSEPTSTCYSATDIESYIKRSQPVDNGLGSRFSFSLDVQVESEKDQISKDIEQAPNVSIKRIAKPMEGLSRINQKFSPYKKLFSIVLLGNLIGMTIFLNRNRDNVPLSTIITASSSNILVAILVRQEYLVNSVYRLCWYTPHSWPLWARILITKVYEHGGIHSGAAVAGTIWLLLLVVLVIQDFVQKSYRSVPVLTVCLILLLLLTGILLSSIPTFRSKRHNAFERTHRFAGWTATAMFWIAIFVFAHDSAISETRHYRDVLIHTPSFWILLLITIYLVLPWLRLRKQAFTAYMLSDRSIRLDFEAKYPPVAGIGISESPLMEWHPFATFPNPTGGKDCHSIIISHTGDWTRRIIDNPKPQYWLKGIPKIGLLSLALVYRSVLLVTTGSGIGPCLSLLMTDSPRRSNTKCRLVWSTPNPVLTYGSDLYHSVLRADPEATIIDTKLSGRPDLVDIAFTEWSSSDIEAVFVISNKEVTRMIVDELNGKGVPAFGPIWDS
ncbi:hypothetical protein BT63DRAFT_435206 [Microthyrium microscopicum]|uniref:Integral membrane protein TmpA n=1 Tax=Microthyrium microscopicum TaxID=703497 RepID=A0A6A6UST7_9PEZI|nr:hypothetical protein BT63DRAFT_435206 [Microthyrium microscopicum]